MSFIQTCRRFDYDVENGYLMAECQDYDGNYRVSVLKLNGCLGNDNGQFDWGGENWMETATDIWFSPSPPTIHCKLKDWNHEWQSASVCLDTDNIENHNGTIRYNKGWFGQLVEDVEHAIEGFSEKVGEFVRTVSGFAGGLANEVLFSKLPLPKSDG